MRANGGRNWLRCAVGLLVCKKFNDRNTNGSRKPPKGCNCWVVVYRSGESNTIHTHFICSVLNGDAFIFQNFFNIHARRL